MGLITELENLRHTLTATDRELIGDLFQAVDEGQDFVSGDDNYIWYYVIGLFFRPKVIAEMGSRFGYSMKCFVDGAGHTPDKYLLRSFDNECDGLETITIFEHYFRVVRGINDLVVVKADTRDLTTLGLDNQCDLCLVDALHTAEGCQHECELAWDALKVGGVMVVDDINYPLPLEGLTNFCANRNVSYQVLESFRGTAIVLKV